MLAMVALAGVGGADDEPDDEGVGVFAGGADVADAAITFPQLSIQVKQFSILALTTAHV